MIANKSLKRGPKGAPPNSDVICRMKHLILIAFLFIPISGMSAESRSLNDPSDLVGTWRASESASGDKWVVSMEVTYSGEITVKDTSHYEGLEFYLPCKSAINQVQMQDDLFIFSCENTKKTKGKVVLGGRQTGDLKQLFGVLYFYSDGQIWKGMKIEMEQSTDNKSSNTDAGAG